jgi:ferritin-like metal-binding protein YciE
MKVIESELEQLNTQIKDTASLKSQLNQHLQAAEQQIITLQTRKENLSARTARNAVHHSVGSLTDQGDLDNVFERWEQNVVADEYLSTSTLTPVDEFENSFNEKEEREALEQTLETLLRENDEKGKAHE